MLLAPDAHNQSLCPIWDGVNLGDIPTTPPEVIPEAGNRYYSSRAGGPFRLMQSGAALLALDPLVVQSGESVLPAGQQANLSYWIYQHNLENRLLDGLTDYAYLEGSFQNWMDDRRARVLELDETWVVDHRDRTPSASDRMLTFLRELIRCDDAGGKPNEELLQAAGGCRHEDDLKELRLYAIDREWLRGGGPPDSPSFPYPDLINLDLGARIHVEEKTREQGRGQQGFVAMWFDESMDDAYKCGIKLAIKNAGYKPRLIKEKDYLGGVVDEIMAEIRKSRFVVADFTSSPEAGARGGVYFEAGFAYGLDIPVFLTCRKDRTEAVHFDIGHLNRLEWETPEDLRKQLQNCIEAVLGSGPLDPPRQQPAA